MIRSLLIAFLLFSSLVTIRADEVDDKVARDLTAIVRDPRLATSIRAEAARTLAKMGTKARPAREELAYQLSLLRNSEQESLQEAVVEALGAMGASAKPALPDLVRATSRTIDLDLAIKDATKRLLDDDNSVDLRSLLEQLRSRDETVRLRSAKRLGGLGRAATKAVPALTNLLADTDADVRRAVRSALLQIQPSEKPSKEFVQSLILDLKESDDSVRLEAARALGKLGPSAAEAASGLQSLISDPDKDVRRAAVEALAKIAKP